MEIVLNRHLFKEKQLWGRVSGRRAALGSLLLFAEASGGGRSSFRRRQWLPGLALAQQHPPGPGGAAPERHRSPCTPSRGAPGTAAPALGERPPPARRCLIIAQRRHFGFIAFIYYKKTSVCFLKQLSGQIVADKQCWSVFLRQAKFITFHLFIYFVRLWWWHVFFFK